MAEKEAREFVGYKNEKRTEASSADEDSWEAEYAAHLAEKERRGAATSEKG